MPSRRRTPPARTAVPPRVQTQPFRRWESPGGTRSGRPQRAPTQPPNPVVPPFHLRRRRSGLITPGRIGCFDLPHSAALFGGGAT
uniref:Uncharacterized protein n=1 Tax=Oryza rufipogon TaxID=4529 RepID=A0A0E0NTK9_ORYRU